MTVNERVISVRADTGSEEDWFFHPAWKTRETPPESANAGNPWCSRVTRLDAKLVIKHRALRNRDATDWFNQIPWKALEEQVKLTKIRCPDCGRRLTPELIDYENGYRDFGLRLPPHKIRNSDVPADPIETKIKRRAFKKRERRTSRGR